MDNDISFGLCAITSPPNDLCSGALLLAGTVTGDNTIATADDLTGLPSCGSTISTIERGLWYKATPTASGSLTIASCGSSFNTYLSVYSGQTAIALPFVKETMTMAVA